MDEFFQSSDGDVGTQVLQFANVSGSDGLYICAKVINVRPLPSLSFPLSLSVSVSRNAGAHLRVEILSPTNSHPPKPNTLLLKTKEVRRA